jgi:hypothetical protein
MAVGKSNLIRGKVIGKAIYLEKTIDLWLSEYFCHNKGRAEDLFYLILCHDRLGFEAKRQVFCYVVEHKCNDFFRKYPTLNKDLSYIIEQRNILAHYQIDSTVDGLDSIEVGFLKVKNKQLRVPFTKEKIEDLYHKMGFYANAIKELVHPPLD